jgi:hypothetical protein
MVKGCLQYVITTVGTLADVNNGPDNSGGAVHRIQWQTARPLRRFQHAPPAVGGIDNLQPFKGQKVLAILALVDRVCVGTPMTL